jgi:hypothetical protein
MLVLEKEEVSNALILELKSNLNSIEDKIEFFKKKYKKTFESFEIDVSSKKEDFEKWDDFIEWKAYYDFYKITLSKIKDLENGDFKIN